MDQAWMNRTTLSYSWGAYCLHTQSDQLHFFKFTTVSYSGGVSILSSQSVMLECLPHNLWYA